MNQRGIFLVLAMGCFGLATPGQSSQVANPVPTVAGARQEQGITPPPAGQAAMQATSRANASAAAGNGQQSSTQEDDTVATIRKTVNEVNVVFTVTDKHGRYIKDLKKNDFTFNDDSKPAAEIRAFKSQTDLPLQVGLLVDASNSVRDRFKFEQESAIEFLNQTVRPHYDSAFVVGFDATPEITQDFTDDTGKLAHGVHELRPGGGTALYDALYYACRERRLKAPNGTPGRRAIILLSD